MYLQLKKSLFKIFIDLVLFLIFLCRKITFDIYNKHNKIDVSFHNNHSTFDKMYVKNIISKSKF